MGARRWPEHAAELLAPVGDLGASRNVTGTWSLGTITSPEKIRSMQAVYLRAIRGRAAGDPAFGWLKIGGKGDVPRQASYVGRFERRIRLGHAGRDRGAFRLDPGDHGHRHQRRRRGALWRDGGSPRGMAGPTGVSRRNFQVPPVGPVFTPGVH